ncbi:MAG: GTP pyrophosphokinase [Gammaproteobacteria bacterium]|nr:GTP pyrophosphokinase [Gammaproteobacteria bacterium]
MEKIQQIQSLMEEMSRVHLDFSKDYFETGRIKKFNLSKTFGHIPVSHIYQYRLALHECINDYLMTAKIDIKYFYRVKTRESIDAKIQRFLEQADQYPVHNWLNDIFGARIVLTATDIQTVIDLLEDWKNTLGLKNWYLRDKEGYRGLHIYFKNKSNVFFPWELQIWDDRDMLSNIRNHAAFKRTFMQLAT